MRIGHDRILTIARRPTLSIAVALVAALACLVAPIGGARHVSATSGTLTPLAAEAHELDLLNAQRLAVRWPIRRRRPISAWALSR